MLHEPVKTDLNDQPSAAPTPPRRRGGWLFTGIYHTGVLLVWAGVLTFGFAGWQLWGTGLHTAQAQEDLASEFDALVDDIATAAPVTTTASLPATTTTAAATTSTTTEPASADSVPDTTAAPEPTTPVTNDAPQTTLVTVTESTVVPSRPTSASNWFKVSTGDPVARIEIPAIGVDAYVIAGVTKEALRDGPGHYPGSVFPGQIGNSVIAGHRTTYGAVFGDLDRLHAGDEIIVTIPTGDRYTYTMSSSEVVTPDNVGAVMSSTIDAELTLLTCTPKYTAHARLIVHATLDAAHSSVLWEAPPDPITQYTDHTYSRTIAVDDTDTVAVEVIDEVTGETVTVGVPADVQASEVRVANGDVIVPEPDDSTPPYAAPEVTSGLDDGWFADTSAILPAVLWFAAFAGIVAAARRLAYKPLSRRFGSTRPRRALIAAAVVLVASPAALWCLWWVYTNTAQLLPGSV